MDNSSVTSTSSGNKISKMKILGIIGGGTILVLTVILLSGKLSGEDRNNSIPNAKNISLPGRILRGDVGFPVKPLDEYDVKRGVKYTQVLADECLDLKAVAIHNDQLSLLLAAKNNWPKPSVDYGINPFPLRIRYFDKNGKYLGHFQTKEDFIPEWGYEPFLKEGGSFAKSYEQNNVLLLPLAEEGTLLKYTINTRDADHIAIVEVSAAGFNINQILQGGGLAYLTKRVMLPKDTPKNIAAWVQMRGININERGWQSRTLVDMASYNDRVDILDWLKKNGADINMKDSDGKMPMDYLTRNSDVWKWFKNNGGISRENNKIYHYYNSHSHGYELSDLHRDLNQILT